jgi:hypothetical protein
MNTQSSKQADPLEPYRAMLASMDPKAKAELDRIIKKEMSALWSPDPRNIPQMVAYESKADLLLYGGAAGGGKTDLLCGTALTRHERSVIFRAQYKDLRGVEERVLQMANKGGREGYNGQDMVLKKDGRTIEFGALGGVGQEMDWMGRPHDFYGFDEGAQLSAHKVNFVTSWLRTTTKGQRTRIIIASNPPIGGEGEWLIEWFAPWLDPMYPDMAQPGELRWAYVGPDGHTVWCATGDVVKIGLEEYQPLTRTFIPARLEDNPYLDTKYKAQIQSLPEPLRSKLLKGDFLAGREDHAWQVIPTDWVRAAQGRWKPGVPNGLRMLTIGVDIGGGGNNDPHVMAPLYGNWFDRLTVVQGIDAKNGPELAGQIMTHRKDGALVILDMTGGWGGSAKDHLASNNVTVEPCIFNSKSGERTKDDKYRFSNLRAEMLWRLREALDPSSGENIALPPDERLTAELTSARWRPKSDTIQVEDKDEIRHRLGGSPDRSDAVMMAWHFRRRAMRAGMMEDANMKEAVELDDPFRLLEDADRQ